VPPRFLTSRCLIGIAFLAALAVLVRAAPAQAADPVEEARVAEAENLIARMAEFREARKKADLERAFARLPKVHNELKTAGVRTRLQKALAGVMGDDTLGGTRCLAADTLGRLNDPKGAWKALKPFLPAVKVEAVGPLPLRVIQAVGALAPDAALPSLGKLMEKAKDANVSRYAIGALGKYGWSKRRESVLRDLLDFLRKLRPGKGDPRNVRGVGRAARERYEFLRLSLVAALNELTGQKYDSAEQWLVAHKEHKKSLAKLFTFER